LLGWLFRQQPSNRRMILGQFHTVLFTVTLGDLILRLGLILLCLVIIFFFLRRKFQEKTEVIQIQLRREAIYSNLGHRLSAATTKKQAAQVIFDVAQELFGWDAAAFRLYDSNYQHVEPVLDIDTVDGKQIEVTAKVEEISITPIMRQIFEKGPKMILRKSPKEQTAEVEPFGNMQRLSASLMFVPIRNAKAPIGLLSIQSYTTDFYDEAKLASLQMLADHCGGAVARIAAQEELRKTLDEMERRVGERTTQLSMANEKLQQEVGQHKKTEEALARGQRLLEAIMDNVPDLIYFKDLQGRFIRVNSAFANVFGSCEPEVMIGKTDFDYLRPEAAKESFEDEQKIIQSGQPLIGKEEHEYWLNGNEWWVLTTKMLLRDEGGTIVGTFGVTRDITPHKKAEEALQKAHASLERRVDDRTMELSMANELLKNENAERTLAEIRSQTFSDLGQSLSRVQNAVQAAELILATADKLIGWDAAYLHLFTHEGKVVPVLMFDLINGRRGVARDNGRGQGLSEKDRQVIENGAELVLREPSDVPANIPLFGDNRPSMSLMYVPIRTGENSIGVVSVQSYTPYVYTDETLNTLQTLADFCAGTLERIQAEQALRESEERFSKSFLSSPVPMTLSLMKTGRYLSVNDATCKLFGYAREEIIGYTSIELGIWTSLEARAEMVDRVVKFRSVRDMECKIRTKGGRVRTCLFSVVPMDFAGETTILVTIHDITERLSLEEQLRHSQKMEGIGQLAAGVAHDFNNILTVIQGHASLLSSQGEVPARAADSIEQIASAAQRASNLTRQLLTFSRKEAMSPRQLDLNDVVGNTTKMLHRLLGEAVSMQFNYSPFLPSIFADSGLIEQVLLNLAVNARDAMPEGGQVVVSTGLVEFEAVHLLQNAERRPGPFACLTVSDSGCGIPKEYISRIFEPFFTTKEAGRGTGLGLAMVYGIVKQHQGWIEVESASGKGATFKVFLPVDGEYIPVIEPPPPEPLVGGGTETIFIVEDEPALRELVREILQFHGYNVVEAVHGKDALRIWPDKKDQIDLLLTDMVMPEGVSGLVLARQLKSERPNLKVIYTSGYSMDLFDSDQKLSDGFNFLPKPYHPQLLIKTIRECLDGV
ncbi:MAG: multi-sensor hybrid histidine kinase, partial [Verrucomicrobiales bacterium]|nr:multi-sensor hybrid histidine kinase [Verrucomicrobiales bacterium]